MRGKHSKNKKDVKSNQKMTRRSSRTEKRKKNIISFFVSSVCIALLIYSVINIYIWYKDSKAIKNEVSQLNKIVTITETTETEEGKEEIKVVESEEEKSSPYWDYIKMNLIDVDFKELEKVNSDVKGWVQVNGTNINYPFVQTSNNDYYLTHSITKQKNSAGWVFMDNRNNAKSFNKNTILYAHARVNQYMFGSLKNTLKKNWLNNTNNHVIKLSTQSHNTLWQVFSVYHIPTNNDYIQTVFSSDDEFLEFTNMLKNRSIHNFNTTINKDDKVLTLSTCYGNNEKLVVHAKLIKYTTK